MYRAKDRGRSRFELFDEALRRRATERIELEAAIRQAIERGELCVHYQPHLVLHGMEAMAGIEALVRWQHPTRGLLAAREFMPLADELGHALGVTVIAEGVETDAQIEQLRELGCDAAQGYAIGRPVSDEQLEALL